MLTKPQFELALAEMGPDHVFYSEDYSYLTIKHLHVSEKTGKLR